jgi:hypothetical protein
MYHHHPYGYYGRLGYYGQAPTPPGCNRPELERRVNACIDQTRQCAETATRNVAQAMIRCGPSNWCRVRAMARYWWQLRRCRENLLACDRVAKRDTGCA